MMALYIIGGIILLMALLAFVVTTAFEHKAEIVINRPKAEVFDYLKPLKNQESWNIWDQMDKDKKQVFTGTDGTVGFVEAWEGKKAGKGAQEIKKIIEGERIESEMRFEKPFKLTNDVIFTTVTLEGNKTKVAFIMSGNSPRPFNLIFPLMKGKMTKDFQKCLSNLKTVLEK